MVVEVIVGSVLVLLGFCALLGLPALAIHLQRRDERSHQFELAGASEIQAFPYTVAHLYEAELAPRRVTPDVAGPGAVYHS